MIYGTFHISLNLSSKRTRQRVQWWWINMYLQWVHNERTNISFSSTEHGKIFLHRLSFFFCFVPKKRRPRKNKEINNMLVHFNKYMFYFHYRPIIFRFCFFFFTFVFRCAHLAFSAFYHGDQRCVKIKQEKKTLQIIPNRKHFTVSACEL